VLDAARDTNTVRVLLAFALVLTLPLAAVAAEIVGDWKANRLIGTGKGDHVFGRGGADVISGRNGGTGSTASGE
jgi:hypothetical protein